MAQSIGLLDHFSALKDPREQWRVLYPLREVLLLLLCGTLSGMDDFVEINLWGRERLDFLRRFLPFEHGVPSHDTLNDIVNAMDGKVFQDCFTSWVETLRDSSPDIVAIDGKTSRRTHARSKGREPLHLVSAWASRQRLVLGQEAVTDKSNEIVAIPLLLKRLELKGALVTIDAIGTQVEIAKIIVNGGGDYLLALKDNWPAFRAEVETFFADDTNATAFQTFDTTDAAPPPQHPPLSPAVLSGGAFPSPPSPRPPQTPPARGKSSGRNGTTSPPQARRKPIRQCGPSPLGHREPSALGPRRRLPRRPRAAANRLRAAEYGRRQAHRHEPDPSPQRPPQPQEPQKTRMSE